ncbi:cyanophycinase [Ruminiclostridium sufflavum DSM 19573]|uniref:Cyanophycinase n=1 Tax=Ruminiclostridium sufflavum DSM 19573 TaxID=1121337 RepID=A0A318XMS7_9FIRM|nr:cyanophycinase [Ruminiclostridium sufflavum]PYG89162.1 cyanophycinase [Ruminiclostridium sufflavum DSM 19573]
MSELVNGNLLIIGGAEDKWGQSSVLKHAIEMCGGAESKIIVLTTATQKPQEVGEEYRTVFTRLGVKKLDILNIDNRNDANEDSVAQLISGAAGIFFTGGDQLRITSILGGTKAFKGLLEAYMHGVPIIGTSAGASAMSSTMIVDGNSNSAARKCTLGMSPGLGLLNQVIIDQHFEQRGRLGRLLVGVAQNPSILGIGIDEDTAIKVQSNASFEVVGTNCVTVIDGTTIKKSNVSELNPEEMIALSNVTIHVLPCGFGFDLINRTVKKTRVI